MENQEKFMRGNKKGDKKKFYRRKFKHVSVGLFKEQGFILSDVLYIQYNVNAENINLYDVIYFHRKRLFIPICKSFSRPRRVHRCAEIAKNRMKELIEKEPTISSSEIKNITGYDWPIITRYYMRLKKDNKTSINKRRKDGNCYPFDKGKRDF